MLRSPVWLSRNFIGNVAPGLWKVVSTKHSVPDSGDYFPERYLSEYLKGETVWTIERDNGASGVISAYRYLFEHINLGTVVLVDGGTDSLCFGDEEGLGTPEEDNSSIAAANALPNSVAKYLCALGWGVDTFHGVNHNLVLENIARLTKLGGYLGVSALLPGTEEFETLKSASKFAFARMQTSIVLGSVLHAIDGDFGDVKFTERTAGSKLFLNPLMGLYWNFRLDKIVECNLFVRDPKFAETKTFREISLLIFKKRKEFEIRKASAFPH